MIICIKGKWLAETVTLAKKTPARGFTICSCVVQGDEHDDGMAAAAAEARMALAVMLTTARATMTATNATTTAETVMARENPDIPTWG
jgi:hypothetical protein